MTLSIPAAASPTPHRPVSVPPTLRIKAFEGPLDLLFHLVRAGEMDIFDLPITVLCDQYTAYLNSLAALDLQVAGEFFVMAATLLEIKSRLLLPAPPKPEKSAEAEGSEPDADPRAELVRRLLEYGKYQNVSENLLSRESERRGIFFRAPSADSVGTLPPPRFGEMSPDALLRALTRMLGDVGAGERAITAVRRQKITLRMKMREVVLLTERAGKAGVAIADLVPLPPFALLEIVLLFLALLELMKAGRIAVFQETFCGEIRLFFRPEATEAIMETERRIVLRKIFVFLFVFLMFAPAVTCDKNGTARRTEPLPQRIQVVAQSDRAQSLVAKVNRK